jgi:hypothetical protein
MKCFYCGAECNEGVKFCSMCGKPAQTPVVTPGIMQMRHCVGCGRIMPWEANVCQYCGHDYRGRPREKSKEKLITGSILTLLAGLLSITLVTLIISMNGDIAAEGLVLATLVYVCSILGILGGLIAMTRVSYPFAVLGAACSIVGPAFFFGIPGLVLIAQSSKEFDREAQSI